jgi:hypothetical protein
LLQQKYWEVMELLRVMHYLEDVRPFVLGSWGRYWESLFPLSFCFPATLWWATSALYSYKDKDVHFAAGPKATDQVAIHWNL